MNEELKPCPFCGEKLSARAKLISYSQEFTGSPFLFFKCRNLDCGAVVSFDNEQCNRLPETAIRYWNRRAEP